MKNLSFETKVVTIFVTLAVLFFLDNRFNFFKVETVKLEGYIISTQNKFEWIKSPDSKFMIPRTTVQVQLNTGQEVEAEVFESHPYCVRFRDYPEAEGKRVRVTLKKREGRHVILWGEIEPQK